ncbi:Adrenodoxin reductase [Intoshia linei]|uniref:Adrenodoxin reductase n=1 Tax=Intoshia linei TaxID=1819745 RepID=A0A177B1R5_9BILA|nr:Adrenodoxin reductase [Intoshia linei]
MLRIAVIGAGPAGFYTSQKLLKFITKIKLDIFEKLPVPYGLVRYGVSPDHPDVKNCTRIFDKILEDNRVRFFGNVEIGKSIPLTSLANNYNAILLSIGASPNHLKFNNSNFLQSADCLISWINGHPDYHHLKFSFENVKTVSIIGQGNVAIDVARLLSLPIEKLEKSSIDTINIIGRRGPLDMACTTAELRELTKIGSNVNVIIPEQYFSKLNSISINDLSRIKKRFFKLLSTLNCNKCTPKKFESFKNIFFHYYLSPYQCNPNECNSNLLRSIHFINNENNDRVEIETDLAFESVGYKYDVNIYSNVLDKYRISLEGQDYIKTAHNSLVPVFSSGWCKNGAQGVIAATMQCAYHEASNMISHFQKTNYNSNLLDISHFIDNGKYILFIDTGLLNS